MVVLVDGAEEVTDMRSSLGRGHIASPADRPWTTRPLPNPSNRACPSASWAGPRIAVFLLGSLTRLSRAYNLAARLGPVSCSGGVGVPLYPPKKGSSARPATSEGGSLTIIASALVVTGSEDGRGHLRVQRAPATWNCASRVSLPRRRAGDRSQRVGYPPQSCCLRPRSAHHVELRRVLAPSTSSRASSWSSTNSRKPSRTLSSSCLSEDDALQ